MPIRLQGVTPICLLSVLLTGAATATPPAPPEHCVRTVGTARQELHVDVVATADDTFVLLGSVDITGSGDFDLWLLEVDAEANLLREITLGGDGAEHPSSLVPTPDGGWFLTGDTTSFGASGGDMWLLKLDADWNVEWQERFGGRGVEGFQVGAIPFGADGGYLVTTDSDAFTLSLGDVVVMTLSADGGIVGQGALGRPGDDLAIRLSSTSDGGAIFAGVTPDDAETQFEGWIVKLDATAAVEWERRMGREGLDVAWEAVESAAGGFVVVGYGTSGGSGLNDLWVFRFDPDGGLEWETYIGGSGSELGGRLLELADGSWLVTASTNSTGTGSRDALLLKLSADGELLWQRAFGGSGDDRAIRVFSKAGGELILFANTNSFGAGESDVWILRLDSEGRLAGDCPIVLDPAMVQLDGTSPNLPTVTRGSEPIFVPVETAVAAVPTLSERTLVCAPPPTIECPPDVTIGTGPDDEDCRAEHEVPLAEALAACGLRVDVSHDAPASFPLGDTIVRQIAVDELGGTAECTHVVTVEDDTRPRVSSIALQPDCIWPPRHAWVRYELSRDVVLEVADNCDEEVSVRFTGCSSNEPLDGLGDGAFQPDCLLEDETLLLRAERSGLGEGRTYTIDLAVADGAGNETLVVATVRVAHDQRDHDCPKLPNDRFEGRPKRR